MFQDRSISKCSNTSDLSSTQDGNMVLKQSEQPNTAMLMRRKHSLQQSGYSKEKLHNVKLEPSECIILCTYSLPYRLQSHEPGVFTAEKNYPAPSFLFANLDDLA